MIERDSTTGGTPGHSAGADESRADSFDGGLLVYGTVIGPMAALFGAATATLAGATRTLTVIAAVAAVALAGFCADPALKRWKSRTRRA